MINSENIKKGKLNSEYSLAFLYFLSVLIALIVYFTGGTSKAYANLMYLPIAIVASTQGKKQGVIHAVISALLIGPLMSLDVEANINQETINWVMRLLIYAVIAWVIGFFADYRREEFEQISRKEQELSDAKMATIYGLVKLAEYRDDSSGAHVERVALFTATLANKLRKLEKYINYIDDDYVDNIAKASTLHDIGKVGIPDSILLKPGKLSPEEFEIMKTHPIIGAKTLLDVKKKYPDNKFLGLGINITSFHHEKWDGTGYPRGLRGEKIPLSARIMAIVDVYDAVRSERVYKEAYSHKESIEILKEGRGTYFEPLILDVFLENEKEFENIYLSGVTNTPASTGTGDKCRQASKQGELSQRGKRGWPGP